jgi:hypothetical protein
MSMLRICGTDGCETRTLGRFCAEHELSIRPAEPARRPESFFPPFGARGSAQAVTTARRSSEHAGAP